MSDQTECASCRCAVLVPDPSTHYFHQRYGGDVACGKPAGRICAEHAAATLAGRDERIAALEAERDRLFKALTDLGDAYRAAEHARATAMYLSARFHAADPDQT